MNKKVIWLGVFLVLSLYIINGCKEISSIKTIKDGSDGAYGKDRFCDDGTPVGKCDREQIKFYCDENKILTEDCTRCYGYCDAPRYCNIGTKECTLNKQDICPPY